MSLRHSDTAWSLGSDHIINSLTFIYIPTWVCNTLRSPHKMIWAIIRHLSLTIEYLREFVTHWGPNNMVEVHVIFTHTYWSYTLRSPHTIDSLTHTYRCVWHIEVPTHDWFNNTYLQECGTRWGPHTWWLASWRPASSGNQWSHSPTALSCTSDEPILYQNLAHLKLIKFT